MQAIVSIMTITLGQLLIEYALYELKAHSAVVLQFWEIFHVWLFILYAAL